MEWLYILLGILLLFFLIGQIMIRITVIYRDEPEVLLRVLFFNIRLVPGKKKKIRLKDYRIKRFRKMRLKERAKLREKARKAAEKKAKKKAKKEPERAKKEAARKAGKIRKKTLRERYEDLKGKTDFGLSIVKGVAGPLVARLYKSLRVKVTRLRIIVATGDAAKTAQAYGIVCAAVADLLELLGQTMHLKYEKGSTVTVIPDFVSEKTTMDIHICFGFRIRHILALPFGAAVDFIKLLIHKS